MFNLEFGLEALWSMEFFTNRGTGGAGVIVLETQRAFGGDNSYYYVGNYEVNNGIVTATVTATHYSGPVNSIIGNEKQFTISLSGKHDEPSFDLDGTINGDPNAKIKVRLTKKAILP